MLDYIKGGSIWEPAGSNRTEIKTRTATPYEQWLKDNYDQKTVDELLHIFGKGTQKGDVNNMIEFESAEGGDEAEQVQPSDEGVTIDDFGDVGRVRVDSVYKKLYGTGNGNDSGIKYMVYPAQEDGTRLTGSGREISEEEYDEYLKKQGNEEVGNL